MWGQHELDVEREWGEEYLLSVGCEVGVGIFWAVRGSEVIR
jgi:hypothetical protein